VKRVYLVGYQRLGIDALKRMLKEEGVTRVLDIRRTGYSKRVSFEKSRLCQELFGARIGYSHLPWASNPYRSDDPKCLEKFEAWLDDNLKVIQDLTHILESEVCALLCVCSRSELCHRGVIASRLTGFTPVHLPIKQH